MRLSNRSECSREDRRFKLLVLPGHSRRTPFWQLAQGASRPDSSTVSAATRASSPAAPSPPASPPRTDLAVRPCSPSLSTMEAFKATLVIHGDSYRLKQQKKPGLLTPRKA